MFEPEPEVDDLEIALELVSPGVAPVSPCKIVREPGDVEVVQDKQRQAGLAAHDTRPVAAPR